MRRRGFLAAPALLLLPKLVKAQVAQKLLLSGGGITVPRGLVLYCLLNGDGSDISGDGNTLTLSNSPSFVAGLGGQAISFNGTNQKAAIAAPAGFNFANGLSFGGIVSGNSAPGTAKITTAFINGAATPGSSEQFYFNWDHTTAANKQAGGISTSGSAPVLQLTSVLAPNTNYAIMYTWDLSTVRAYLNGLQQASAATTGTLATPSGGYAIGGYNASQFLACKQQFNRVANVCYSASEVMQIANANLAGRK